MNWPLVIWSMLAAACLTLAAIHLPIWLRDRTALASLFISLMSVSTAALMFAEAWMMQARTIQAFGEVLRWMHLPVWVVLASLLGFVYVYLDAGRLWLAWSAIAARTLALVLNFTTGVNINFQEITQLRRVPFMGEQVSVVSGIGNPWGVVAQLSLLLCLAFIVDASATAWRRGERAKVVWVGGSSVFFLLAGGIQAVLIIWGGLEGPTTIGLFLVGIVAAMAYSSGRSLMQAQHLAAELGESELRMSMTAGAAKVGIWTRDLVHGQTWADAQWRELFGLTPTEPMSPELLIQRVHPDDRERLRQELGQTLQSPGVYHTEFRIELPDGAMRWIGAQGQAEFDARGRPVRTRGAFMDCTARKQSEQELLLLRSEITHVGRVSVMGQLASALAHEINQPLGAILRNAEAAAMYLQEVNPDLDEIRAIVEDIRKDDQRAGAVIDRMRLLLRRHDVQMQPLGVAELLGDVAALVRPEAVARHVKVELDIARDVARVAGDRVHLQQVLLNLVANGMDSIDESSRNGRSICVSARRDGTQSVVIAVKDSGRGMAPHEIAQLFEPFFTTKAKGMGMGLSISRTIVEAHGGRLWAQNNDDGGALFSFTVPAVGDAIR